MALRAKGGAGTETEFQISNFIISKHKAQSTKHKARNKKQKTSIRLRVLVGACIITRQGTGDFSRERVSAGN
jgi:hypothetical protein